MTNIKIMFCVSVMIICSINAFAQVKIGEVVNGVGVITHNEQDLIQALQKEYDINQGTTFNYVRILNYDSNYWLVAGDRNPAVDFNIAIPLKKNVENNDLNINRDNIAQVQKCADCKMNCYLLIGINGPAGCSDCMPTSPGEFCNHKSTLTVPSTNIVVVERYLQITN